MAPTRGVSQLLRCRISSRARSSLNNPIPIRPRPSLLLLLLRGKELAFGIYHFELRFAPLLLPYLLRYGEGSRGVRRAEQRREKKKEGKQGVVGGREKGSSSSFKSLPDPRREKKTNDTQATLQRGGAAARSRERSKNPVAAARGDFESGEGGEKDGEADEEIRKTAIQRQEVRE